MGTIKKINTLHQFVDWVNNTQKDISRIGRRFENVFDDELESGNVEISELINNISELFSMADNLKNCSIALIQQYESD